MLTSEATPTRFTEINGNCFPFKFLNYQGILVMCFLNLTLPSLNVEVQFKQWEYSGGVFMHTSSVWHEQAIAITQRRWHQGRPKCHLSDAHSVKFHMTFRYNSIFVKSERIVREVMENLRWLLCLFACRLIFDSDLVELRTECHINVTLMTHHLKWDNLNTKKLRHLSILFYFYFIAGKPVTLTFRLGHRLMERPHVLQFLALLDYCLFQPLIFLTHLSHTSTF
ncbi:hypothetical protein EGR_09902 [Echinococcus granulosus]|uniref:Uncharacterized protein n=1 Tax=Echinococcus granulosus TaxID=6210 RepID=W6UP89_ECHGR|nr:hypothetical protein EGR_09902 [Echinococcus granulosus]EUB55239.1 hypothetical protein EGR_09902 [Echinococcus granulosus]